jgi:hypothetical protein
MFPYFLFNIYLVFGLPKLYKIDYECSSRISSLFHACICLVASLLFLNNYLIDNLRFEIIKYNVVYLITDIYLYLTKRVSNKDLYEMLIHHTFFILGCYSVYLNPINYTIFYSLGLMTEGSTIFLNTRWFSIKKYYFRKIEIHTLLLWISFLTFRIINMMYILYLIIINNYYYILFVALPFFILNSVWFYHLTLISKKLIINKK